MFECGKTQIVTTLQNKDEILSMWNSDEGAKTQKRLRTGKCSEINHLLWERYNRVRESNVPITGNLLIEEARLIAERLGDETFQGRNGWLGKWKQRYNICQMNIAGEEGDVSEEVLESWNERLRELTRGYAPRDVWNLDEIGCFWKIMPEKSLSQKRKRCRGGKNAKQRLTVAFIVNAAGGKQCPILIGSSKKPRCFVRLRDPSCPYGAQYFNNEKAWMTTGIMTRILNGLNNRLKNVERNVILFLDNAPCNTASLVDMFSNVKVTFLPKNTTSRTQPLDAGVIKAWIAYYRKKLLRHIISQVDSQKNVSDIVKSINLLMAIKWMVESWNDVKPEVKTKCFRHVGMYPSDP